MQRLLSRLAVVVLALLAGAGTLQPASAASPRIAIPIGALIDQTGISTSPLYTTAVRRISYFEVQVTSDGALEIQATGFHAHDGQIHERLEEELQRLGQAIEAAARRYGGPPPTAK